MLDIYTSKEIDLNTREKLLNIAFKEIYTNGYEATSVDTILKKAHINKGSMYHLFKSKKELTLAMIKENVKNDIEMKYGSILEADSNIIDKILNVFMNRGKNDIFCGCKLNNLVQELSHKDNDFKVVLEEIYFRFEEIIELSLMKAMLNNEIKHSNVKNLSIYVVASLEGCLASAKKSQNEKVFTSCIDELKKYLYSLKVNVD